MNKKYTDEEITFVKENYKKLTVKQLAEKLNKSTYNISTILSELGLKKQVHKPWNKEEIEFLKKNYMSMTNTEIAKRLNRSLNSISARMDQLGLVCAKSWTKEDEKFLINHFMDMTHKEIGKILNRTEGAVRAKCFDLNLYKKEEPWTDEEINFLKKHYMEMSSKELSKIMNRTENAIHLQGSRMGIKKYPYFCDYNYFDDINTEEKAYWLGFMAADGWISKREENNSAAVGIELQYRDIKHLKKFNKSINGNYKITDRWKTCDISKNKHKQNHMCVIRIYSITMFNSLVRKGFSPQKSYDYKIPYVQDDLIRHFLRGYFDGDGCFCFTNKSFNLRFLTAAPNLHNDVYNILINAGVKVSQYQSSNELGTIMYYNVIYGLEDKIKLLDYMYEDCNIYLDRKFKKYLKVKEKYSSTKGLAA